MFLLVCVLGLLLISLFPLINQRISFTLSNLINGFLLTIPLREKKTRPIRIPNQLSKKALQQRNVNEPRPSHRQLNRTRNCALEFTPTAIPHNLWNMELHRANAKHTHSDRRNHTPPILWQTQYCSHFTLNSSQMN